MHPLNVTTLVAGLLCLGISGIWLADRSGWVSHGSYLVPVVLITVGVVGLLAFAGRGAAGRRSRDEVPLDDEEALR